MMGILILFLFIPRISFSFFSCFFAFSFLFSITVKGRGPFRRFVVSHSDHDLLQLKRFPNGSLNSLHLMKCGWSFDRRAIYKVRRKQHRTDGGTESAYCVWSTMSICFRLFALCTISMDFMIPKPVRKRAFNS